MNMTTTLAMKQKTKNTSNAFASRAIVNGKRNEKWKADSETLTQPLKWTKPRRIFVCAHGDLFHPAVPDEWIDRVFAVMALATQHTFQVLTKRPERMWDYLAGIDSEFHGSPDHLNERFGNHCVSLTSDPCAAGWFEDCVNWPLRNVWLGTSVSDQASADERIPHLLATPAAVRFLSAEPLLGPVSLNHVKMFDRQMPGGGWEKGWESALNGRRFDIWDGGDVDGFPRLDWVIAGGESGPGARPAHPDWFRSLRDQCVSAGVPFHFKQWGVWAPVLDRDNDDPDWRANYSGMLATNHQILNLEGGTGFHGERVHVMKHAGKKATGRLLDGREWNEFPKVQL